MSILWHKHQVKFSQWAKNGHNGRTKHFKQNSYAFRRALSVDTLALLVKYPQRLLER